MVGDKKVCGKKGKGVTPPAMPALQGDRIGAECSKRLRRSMASILPVLWVSEYGGRGKGGTALMLSPLQPTDPLPSRCCCRSSPRRMGGGGAKDGEGGGGGGRGKMTWEKVRCRETEKMASPKPTKCDATMTAMNVPT